MIRDWKSEGGRGVRGERGCGSESGSEGGVRTKAEVANNRERRMEGGISKGRRG